MGKWTDEELVEIVVLKNDGLSFNEVGKRVGKSKDSVQQQINKLRNNYEKYKDIFDAAGDSLSYEERKKIKVQIWNERLDDAFDIWALKNNK